MVNERLDPMYKYVDGKIELAKKDMQTIATSLDSRIEKLESILLETRRYVALHSVEDLRLFLETRLTTNLPPDSELLYRKAHEFLLVKSSEARQKIEQSKSPISVAIRFENDCHDFFTSNNLPGFQNW